MNKLIHTVTLISFITLGATAQASGVKVAVGDVNGDGVQTADPASGLPTGKRQHKPFVLTKPVDKGTPATAQEVNNGQNKPAGLLLPAVQKVPE